MRVQVSLSVQSPEERDDLFVGATAAPAAPVTSRWNILRRKTNIQTNTDQLIVNIISLFGLHFVCIPSVFWYYVIRSDVNILHSEKDLSTAVRISL